jgi:hypothetical protein
MDWYTSFAKKLSDNDVDFLADTIKCSIHTSTYTFSAVHDFADDLSAEVAAGGGYSTGGATLATKSTSSADPCVWDCDDIAYAQNGSGFSNGRNLIFYKSTGVAGTSPLICRYGAASDFGNVSGALTIQINSSGLIRLDLQ